MLDLIERLEKATGPDRELDRAIAEAVLQSAYDGEPKAYYYTDSLDAALTLVPEGANCHGYDAGPKEVAAYFSRNDVESGHWLIEGVHSSCVAIAFCIAALRARAANVEARS